VCPERQASKGLGDLNRLLEKINVERGLDLAQYRTAYLERRISSRMRTVKVATYGRYGRYLDDYPAEYDALLDTLTINVTDFFRDRDVYRRFERTVVPGLVKHKVARRQRMIRGWSAGCSTGEEPYSMTMSILMALGDERDDFLISVTGTDLDQSALKIAKKAEYPNDKLSHIPLGHQNRFVEHGVSTFTIRPEVTQCVRFKPLNLFEDDPVHVVDVIFCRNVFIYFTREQQARVMERFWSALHRGGYLVLGRSEKLAPFLAERLELIDGARRIYRKPM
jgi:chemotaxis methyl-accepting protein methylase